MKKKLTMRLLFRYTKNALRERFLFICLYTVLVLLGLSSIDLASGDFGEAFYMTAIMAAPVFLGVAVTLGCIRAGRGGY